MKSPAAAVLAGGQSRRMGRPKALLPLAGSTLVERVLAAAAPVASPTLLIANDPAPFAHLSVPVHPDRFPGLGPLSGLHAALLATDAPALLLLACDLPFLNTEFLRLLVASAPPDRAAAPRSEQGLEPLCALYPRTCLPAVEEALQEEQLSMRAFLSSLDPLVLERVQWTHLDPRDLLLSNLNTPADYERARQLLEN